MLASAKGFYRRWNAAIERLARSAYREEDGAVVSIMGPDVYAAATHGILQSPPSTAHRRLGETEVPVLVLPATLPPEQEEARSAALERFARDVPQAEIRRMDDTPHFVIEDKPDQTAAAVSGWLRTLTYA
ncbi:MAG: hypothetical protein M3R70_06870 [Actinomycetota bacterium]|nr:hypothetical protein [Actinomycetota bacterium]